MRIFAILAATVSILLQSSCVTSQPENTKRLQTYKEKISHPEIYYINDPDFMMKLKGHASGSYAVSNTELINSLRNDMSSFEKVVSSNFQGIVDSSSLGGMAHVIAADTQRIPSQPGKKYLAINPIAAKTSCKPCYSVVTFQVALIDADMRATVWSTELKLIPTRADALNDFWNQIVEALRNDGLT